MTLPLFPLNTVVFPGGRLPLKIFEQRYLAMIKRAIAENTPFGICAIREGQEVGAPAVPCAVGTRVRVGEWDMPQTGILEVEVHADERFVVRDHRVAADGLIVGTVEDVSAETPVAIPPDLALTVELLRHVIREHGETHFPAPHDFGNAVWVGYRLSEVLPLKLSARQDLLEMNDSITRLRILAEFVKRHIN
jgi:Lon protease-like protein